MSILSEISLLDVWRALGGPEPRRGRAPAFWRSGDNPQAVSLNNEKGCWYDFRDHEGGGVIDLVRHVRGCTQAAALAWLEAEDFLEPRTLTHEQRRECARRRDTAKTVALDVAHWRTAFIAELNRHKVAAVQGGDDEALNRAASLCNVIENGAPEVVIGEFMRHRASDSAAVARLIAAGEARGREARRITAEAVLLLARAAQSEDARGAA